MEQMELVKVEQKSLTPLELVQHAISKGIDTDSLEKLVALQERWEANEARKAFVVAMTELQSEIPVIIKSNTVLNKSGGQLYKFAPLEVIVAKVQPLEQKHGFSHKFDFSPGADGAITTTCIVTHRSGHSEPTTVTIPPTKGMNTNSAQDAGIMQTYGMRYAYCGAFGITTANADTDGNLVENDSTVSESQLAEIKALLQELAIKENDKRFLAYLKVDNLEELPASKFKMAIAALEKKRSE